MAESVQDRATRLQAEITALEARRAGLGADELATLSDKITLLEHINQVIRNSAETQQQILKDLELEKQLLEANAKFLNSKQENLDAFVRLEQIEIEKLQINLNIKKEELKVELELASLTEEEKRAKLEAYLLEEKKLLNLKEQLDISGKLGQQTKDIISATMGISARWKETFFGKLLDKDGDSVKNMEAISASIKDTVNIQNIIGSTLMKIQEATVQAFFAYDSAAASLAKVAGANEQLQGVLSNTARGATAYGISFEQAGRAIEGLYTNLNTFTKLDFAASQQLTISVAKLDRLGISSAESAKTIGTLTQIMGMSEVQAGKTSEELAGLALAIGKSPQQVAQDFAGASNQLAAYGNNMVNVFKDLEIQSKATGVAVNDLISIAEKFQTFEGAATAAGKLNAALGGGFINAMELLEASAENPAKAIDLLRTRLDDAGLSFDQMSFYEKKMIADAAGFKSIEEASRVLSMSNAEAEKAARISAERADEQKLLNDAVQRSIPIQEKLTMIMVNFGIVMGPPIDAVSKFMSLIATLFDKVPFLSYVLASLLVIIGGFIIAFKIAASITSFNAAMQALGISLGIVAPVAAPAAVGVGTLATAAGAAAAPVGAFGLALGSVVLPIAALVAAMALMYAGIGYIIKNLVELFKVLANTDSIADSLLSLALAMASVSLIFINPIVMVGLLVFAVALAGIVSTLNKLDKDKSFNFATITKSIAELNVKTTTGPNNAMKQTGELITAINSFSLSKDNTAGLERILKAAMPQQQQAGSTYSPTIIVKIGDKQLKNLVVEVVEPMMGNTAGTL
jgi:hypothetical protein